MCAYIERDKWMILRAVPQLLGGTTHTCSDKIFSGHTLVATLLAAFWFKLCQKPVFRVYAVCNWLAMVCSSLAGRHHYTVDIVVGCLVAALLFHAYHLLLRLVLVEPIVGDLHLHVHRQPHIPVVVKRIISYMDGVDLREDPLALPSTTTTTSTIQHKL